MYFRNEYCFWGKVHADTVTTTDANDIAKEYDAEPVSVSTAKADGATPVTITSKEQLEDFFEGTYEPTSAKIENTIAASSQNLLEQFQPVTASAATTTKTVKKLLWPAKYSTTHVYGNVRLTKKSGKIEKVNQAWTQQTGVVWPIAWHQTTHWSTMHKGRKSGTETFKGSRLYYVVVPKKELAYSRATTFTMTFE